MPVGPWLVVITDKAKILLDRLWLSHISPFSDYIEPEGRILAQKSLPNTNLPKQGCLPVALKRNCLTTSR